LRATLPIIGLLVAMAGCTTPREEVDPRDAAVTADARVPAGDVSTGSDQAAIATGGADGSGASSSPDSVVPLINGQQCQDGAQCVSQNCVDGVCCDTTCRDLCRSCALPERAGTCSAVESGVDPDSCSGVDSVCAGAGICAAIDQRQDAFDATFTIGLVGAGQLGIHAQTLTPARSGRLTAFRLKGHCIAPAILTVQIQAVANGQPNGVVLGSRMLPADVLAGNVASPQLIVLETPLLVKAGVQLALVLRAAQGTCVFTGTNMDAYPGGADLGSFQGQIWQAYNGDMTFQSFITD
jgi:hypothetical protein